MLFEGIAFAQTAAAATPAAPPDMWQQILTNPVVPIAFIGIVFWFVVFGPQRKRAAEQTKMLNSLKRNDEVVTTGGLIGRIAEVSDKLVTLEIAPNVRVRVERSQISALSTHGKAPKREKGDHA